MYILRFFALCRGPKEEGGMAQAPPKYAFGCGYPYGHSILSQLDTIQQVFLKGVFC